MHTIKITLLLFLWITLLSSLPAQPGLSPEQWREDLRFLQKTVHEDYNFLFKKVTVEDFDAEVEKLYAAIPEMEEHEVIVGLSRIVSLFGYGHTSFPLSGWDSDNARGFHQMPYNLYYFSDGLYVEGVHSQYQKALGAKVLKVEGVPVDDALAAVRPAMPVENDQFFKAYGPIFLGTPEILHAQGVTDALKPGVTLTLEKEGKVFDMSFEAVETDGYPGQYSFFHGEGDWLTACGAGPAPLWLKNLGRIYYYEYLPEHKAVYVRHSQIQDDEEEAIPEFYDRVFDFIEANEVERLILDVRLNGGGNNYKNKPIVTSVIRSEKINQPGKFFVIIGRRTSSACQNLVNELDNYTEAVFVGEPTSENINFYGDNRRVVLPNSQLAAYLSFAWWQDKPQWENGPWLAPNIAVEMSFADYQANRDPVLDAIWPYDDDSPIVDPLEYLTELFTTGRVEEIPEEAARMVKDSRYQYYPFEDKFNQTGYRLLNDGQLEPAIFVFQLNTELFPESPNTWDSLAEAHWKAGNKEKAITFYEKAIQMDPDGPTGENARMMLAKVRAGE